MSHRLAFTMYHGINDNLYYVFTNPVYRGMKFVDNVQIPANMEGLFST